MTLERIYSIIEECNPTFKELVEKVEGKPFEEVNKERVNYLNRWIQDLSSQGFVRYDSNLKLNITEKVFSKK